MRLCNDTITVFNAAYDFENDIDVYLPTVISGVSWFYRDNISVDHSGFKNTSSIVIRIPVDADFGGAEYVDPKDYTQQASKSGLWTLQAGDIIVKGLAPDSSLRPADLARLFSEKMTVQSVTDNRRAPNAKHWRVTGA